MHECVKPLILILSPMQDLDARKNTDFEGTQSQFSLYMCICLLLVWVALGICIHRLTRIFILNVSYIRNIHIFNYISSFNPLMWLKKHRYFLCECEVIDLFSFGYWIWEDTAYCWHTVSGNCLSALCLFQAHFTNSTSNAVNLFYALAFHRKKHRHSHSHRLQEVIGSNISLWNHLVQWHPKYLWKC